MTPNTQPSAGIGRRAVGFVTRLVRRVRLVTARAWLVATAVLLVGGAAGVAALWIGPAARGDLGPGEVVVRARFGESRTSVRVPPLGTVSARTHAAPVSFEARVDVLDVEDVQRILERGDPLDRLERSVNGDVGPLVGAYASRALLTALLAGAVAGAILPHRRRHWPLLGAAGGVTTVALLLGFAWATYDPRAFREPRFDGPLERAPAILAAARRHVQSLDDVRARIWTLGDSVAELYAASSVQTDGRFPDEVRILHVSDIHSNPVAVELASRLATGFDVAAVLDTGDLTSFGLPAESRIGELIATIPVPYLLVPGNHDSVDNRQALDDVPNVEVLDGRVVDVGGVRVLGFADPTFTASNETTTQEARSAKAAVAPKVAGRVGRERVDVLAVHDPILAAEVAGGVDAVVSGHLHRRSFTVDRHGILRLGVGSTGATGLESFTVEEDRYYEAQILTFSAGRLVALDYVSLTGLGGEFSLERQVIDRGPERRDAAEGAVVRQAGSVP